MLSFREERLRCNLKGLIMKFSKVMIIAGGFSIIWLSSSARAESGSKRQVSVTHMEANTPYGHTTDGFAEYYVEGLFGNRITEATVACSFNGGAEIALLVVSETDSTSGQQRDIAYRLPQGCTAFFSLISEHEPKGGLNLELDPVTYTASIF